MFDLFYIPKTGDSTFSATGGWSVAKQTLKQNAEKTVSFYRLYPQVISSSHELVRLIYAMAVSTNIAFERYIEYCYQKAYSVPQSLGYTSSISRGKMWDGVFYGNGSSEIIMVNDDWFDVTNSVDNWKDFQSVRVLHHSKSDLNMNIPDGRTTNPEKGLSVVTINVPMLMAQWYHFNVEQDLVERSGGIRRNVMQFVYSYVLTNMIYSHLDYAIFNRLYNMTFDIPVGMSFLRHSFGLPNQVSYIDSGLREYIKFHRNNTRMKIHPRAVNLPAIHAKNFAETLDLPNAAPTMQVYWALIASRVKGLAYLMSFSDDPRRTYAAEINLIQRWLRTHRVTESIVNILDDDAYDSISDNLSYLLAL